MSIMRMVTLMYLFLCTFATAIAQDDMWNNSIRVGVNAAYFTRNDGMGHGNYAEVGLGLGSHAAVVPRIMSASFRSRTQFEFSQSSMTGGSLALRITPLPELYQGLKLDIGALYQRMAHTFGTYDQQYFRVVGSVHKRQEQLFGLLGSLGLGFRERHRLGGGFRLETMTAFREGALDTELWQAGIYLQVRF